MQAHIVASLIERCLNAVTSGAHHFGVNAQFFAIFNIEIVGGGIGVEHRWNIILGVACGKEHAGHSENTGDIFSLQRIQASADDGRGKFEIAKFNRVLWQALFEMLRQHRKFLHSAFITAAMAAEHYTEFFRHSLRLP